MTNEQIIRIARGGGGGSGGGGGGSSGSHSSYSSGGSGTGINDSGLGGVVIAIFLVFIVLVIVMARRAELSRKKASEQAKNDWLEKSGVSWETFVVQFKQLFFDFQESWSKFDLEKLQTTVTENYYKRLVLELGVLQAEKRVNLMESIFVSHVGVIPEIGFLNTANNVVLEVTASARDTLYDQDQDKKLYVDSGSFTEYWHVVKVGDAWKLDLITQSTEDTTKTEWSIAEFAKTNNFFFDPDFGWLMMPNKGIIFNQTSFGRSDINNHVIGYYRNKIVEFYTYIPGVSSAKNYLIAQTILPKEYKNILIKKKGFIEPKPKGLNKQELEWPDFNNKFTLWAHPEDKVNSLELLTPNFMEKIYDLPFELNIEIVGPFLYFYSEDRRDVSYQQMLEVLSWAFDEMKM